MIIYHPAEYRLVNDRIIAIVGTRYCTSEGSATAYQIGKLLALNDITLITGLAKGIDTAAVRGCCKHNGKIIGVRPYIYPIDYINTELYRQIIKNGCIISYNRNKADIINTLKKEYFKRNQLIATLARIIIMVEARYDMHSGTMHYINYAHKMYVWKPMNNEFRKAYEFYISKGARSFSDIDELKVITD